MDIIQTTNLFILSLFRQYNTKETFYDDICPWQQGGYVIIWLFLYL